MQRFREHRFVAKEAATPHRAGSGFFRSEDGSLVIFGLMIFLLMLMAGGLGVDLMRYEAQRVRLQSTLDRAVLAAASMDQTMDSATVVLDYFEKAGLGYYIDAENINVYDNGQLVTGSNAGAANLTSRRVEASAEMVVGASFLRFAGIDWLAAPAHGVAEETASLTEISLVLDTSGSMGWASASGSSKISELRDAATQFVNIMLCDPANPDQTAPCTVDQGKVSVSIVPYSEQVLVGETLLGYFNPTMEHTYSSCVTFAESDFNTTAITDTQLLQREGHIDPWSNDSAAGPDDNRTCQTDAWRQITPVTGDAAVLRSSIASLGAGGNTSIDIGMKWGSAFLDPAAQPVVADLISVGYTDEDYDGRPFALDEPSIEKVIVLMTDGVNTNQHYLYNGFYSGPSPVFKSDHANSSDKRISVYRSSNSKYYWPWLNNYMSWPQDRPYGQGSTPQCNNFNQLKDPNNWSNTSKCSWVTGPGATAIDFANLWEEYSWDWWDDFGFLPSPGSSYGNSTKNARLQSACNAAKAAGIKVFTIGFEVTSASATVMSNCASVPANYFDADGLDLSTAFAAIAREISKLQLVN